MNRMTHRISVLIAIVLLMPSLAPAADLVMTTGSEEISEYVSDVPCVSLEEGAAVEIFLDESGDVFRVYDASGVSYRASSLQEATDGYLRMRNVCVIREIEVRGTPVSAPRRSASGSRQRRGTSCTVRRSAGILKKSTPWDISKPWMPASRTTSWPSRSRNIP